MNQEVIDMLGAGKIPYRYEADRASALYFGVAVLVIIFVFSIVQAITRRYIG